MEDLNGAKKEGRDRERGRETGFGEKAESKDSKREA